MGLFVNGIPLITIELKNQLTGQNIENSENQYRYDRNPHEPLLKFKRCLAHFCIDNNKASMTTKLSGPRTKFLPFNKGIENPQVENDYRVEYMWNEIFTPDNLSEIIDNYVFVTEEEPLFFCTVELLLAICSKIPCFWDPNSTRVEFASSTNPRVPFASGKVSLNSYS